jgi:predicted nucleotidyltransferase
MDTIALERKKPDQLLEDGAIQEMVDAIAERFHPDKIILFGSYAGDRPTPNSDLDLLVIMNSDAPRHRRAAPIRLLFRPTPCPMDILVFTPEEVAYWNGTVNHIITEAMSTGRTVYARAS